MQTVIRFRVLSLAIAVTALFTGCVKRPPSQEETVAHLRSCGGGVLACMYPRPQERSLAAPSAATENAAPVNVDSVLVPSVLVDSLLATLRAYNYWQDASTKRTGVQLDGQSVALEARIGAKYYTVQC